MPQVKLGRKFVTAVKPTDKTTTYWDSQLPGFGLRVFATGAKSWVCEYRPGAGGRGANKRRVTLGSADDTLPCEQARLEARNLLARVRLGADPAAERNEERAGETLKELSQAWLSEHVSLKRKARTHGFYSQVLQSHVLPQLGSKRAILITRQEIARLHSEIGRSGSPYAANHVLAVTRAMFNWALRAGRLPEEHKNPSLNIERFSEQGRERYLSSAEIGRLAVSLNLAETDGIPWSQKVERSKHAPKASNQRVVFDQYSCAAVRLLLLTGCRLREILHLRWEEVDLERALLHLPDSKTGRKIVPIASAAARFLNQLPKVGAYVIASSTAGTLNEKPKADLQKVWTALTRDADIEGVRIHDLRHSFASVGAGGGLGLPQIGAILGHKSAATTKRYSHVANDAVHAAADFIGDKISKAMGLFT